MCSLLRVRRRGVACSALVLRLRWQLLALLKLLILVLLVLRRAPWPPWRQAELQAAALCCLPGASASPVVYTWAPCQACSCPPIAHHAAPSVSCHQCTACVCAVPDMLVKPSVLAGAHLDRLAPSCQVMFDAIHFLSARGCHSHSRPSSARGARAVVASGVRPCAATCVATALLPREHGCCSTGHAHALTHAFLLRQVNRVQVFGGSQAHSSCRASRGLRRATCCSDGVLRVPLRPVRVSAR